jgi:hypothetical protein
VSPAAKTAKATSAAQRTAARTTGVEKKTAPTKQRPTTAAKKKAPRAAGNEDSRPASRSSTARKAAATKTARKGHATKPVSRGGAAPLTRLRKLCLSMPEATEKEAWGTPTFRVRDKLFAMFNDDHHGDGRVAVWCKAALGMQELLIDADRERFFRPPYVGPSGWIGVILTGGVDWDEVHALLADAWRMTAPAKLAALLPAPGDD